MALRVWGALIVASTGLLAGCTAATPTSPPAPIIPSTASVRPSETSSSPTPAELVISLDDVAVIESDGSHGDSAPFSDHAATLALLSDALGRTPEPVVEEFGYTTYDWGGLDLAYLAGYAGPVQLSVTAPNIGGLVFRTPEGISVGMSRAEVVKLAAHGNVNESSVDNSLEWFDFDVREHPGTTAVDSPGQVGTDFIWVQVKDGTVYRITSPDDDWNDF